MRLGFTDMPQESLSSVVLRWNVRTRKILVSRASH
jgi:hypothetical protein